ncbi:hypothetical protein [Corynebacterium accolens]|uniref:hypothetical protein n=1 Tax=Corynebacterium accolens TaxID=38284 RepID=UPI00266FF764|nr:hypothetical protein [Corynebacterium accolens]WKS54909.1 hypothetical protein NLL31_06670 [Corynebacterium accolens]
MSDQDGNANSESDKSQSGKSDGGFKPPQSQEEFDRIIQDRVARAKQSAADEVRKSFEGYVSKDEYDGLKEKYDKASSELGLEYRKAATREVGLPESMAGRLQGESRDDWMNDARSLAESLAGVMAQGNGESKSKGESDSESEEPKRSDDGGKSKPWSRPSEQRGHIGGRPGEQDDFSVDDVLKKIQRI